MISQEFLILLSLLINFSCVSCFYSTREHVIDLQNNLTKNYNPVYRPVRDQQKPIIINVSCYIMSIREFDEKKSLFAFVGIFSFMWYDEYLVWNQAEHGGAGFVLIPQEKIWVPEFMPMNPFGEMKLIGENTKQYSVRALNTGIVRWTPNDIIKANCAADVTYFPFDKQNCTVVFIAWASVINELRVKFPTENINTQIYQENSLWTLTDTRQYTYNQGFSIYIAFAFKFQRKPNYYIINIFLPVLLISLLNVFVFVLPADSGERVGFAVTVLLSMAVFLTIISDRLPETAEPNISAMSFFLLYDIIISTIVTISTVFGLRYYHKKDNEHIAKCYKFIALSAYFLRCKRPQHMRSQKIHPNNCGQQTNIKIDLKQNKENSLESSLSQEMCDQVHQKKEKTCPGNEDDEENDNTKHANGTYNEGTITWNDVAVGIDFYLMVSFIFLILAKYVAICILYGNVAY